MRASKAPAGHRTGRGCYRRWSAYDKPQGNGRRRRSPRSQHDALDALSAGIIGTKVNWILDADIRSFFDEVSQEWLLRFLEHRLADRRITRLIHKWLRAGILSTKRAKSFSRK
jgi:retron-type reverse transcriptase